MEILTQRLKFNGEGSKLLGILVVNLVLTLITFGLYYPWARAKMLQYTYSETEFAGSRFAFHGTGKEMFKGFIKAIAIIGALVLIYQAGLFSKNSLITILTSLIYVIGIMVLIPLAVHGGLRYRLSRTSWRSIHFGYRGNLRELFELYIKGIILTVLTLGIYGSWFSMNIRCYLAKHIRFGNCTFHYEGEGGEYFWLNVKGIVLTIFTFGIYSFWYARQLNHYFFNHLKMTQNGNVSTFRSNLTAGDIFVTGLVNYFLVVFTLGIGTPWALIRQMRMVLNNVELEGIFDPDNVEQTEEDYGDATGEDMLDMLDIGLDF